MARLRWSTRIFGHFDDHIMTYEYNRDDTLINNFPNPFRFENVFLFLAAFATAAGGVTAMITAKGLFKAHEDKVAVIAVAVAALVLSIAVKLLMEALSQAQFYLGRKFPLGLACELPLTETGIGHGTEQVLETLRRRAIDFAEPRGALNGVLYSMVRNLATSPNEVQAAAVQHFHSLIAFAALFVSLVVCYFMFMGTPCEGFASWLYLPMSGLSLVSPFVNSARFDVQESRSAHPAETRDRALWMMIGLVVFSIMAPVIVPRIAPHFDISPMWSTSAVLLVGSMVASTLCFSAIVSRLDSVAQTSVSCEQTTIAMNCAPAQLWTEISRGFQSAWERGIPNRAYANIPPEVSGGERGSFGGFVLEETQPVPTTSLQLASWTDAFQNRYSLFLLLLGAWGVAMATACGWMVSHVTAQLHEMARMEITRGVLIVMALGMVVVLSFRTGHLLWSRIQFKSRILWIETSGTYQTSRISVGNQLHGSALSSSTLTHVQDATLRVWVTDIDSVAFGKDGKRSIIAMAPADNIAKGIANRLIDFAAAQYAIATPSNDSDLARAASIGRLDAVLRGATGADLSDVMPEVIDCESIKASKSHDADARVEGHVKFYDAKKLYGYIVALSGDEYFFNSNSFRGNAPSKRDRVKFRAEHGPKGLIAKQMQVTTDA